MMLASQHSNIPSFQHSKTPMRRLLYRFFREGIKITRLSVFLCQCKLCEKELVLEGEDMICRECEEKVLKLGDTPLVCQHCGCLMGTHYDRCGECLINPPLFRKHTSYGRYEEELKELILKFKYGGVEPLKHLLAGYYIEVFKKELKELAEFDFIVPVPPDKGRKREFHPVMEIAKILSKQLGIQLLPRHLVKVKKTLPQAGLTRSRRLKNLNGAFKLTNAPPSIKGKNILLIDDVYTTGTTIKKCTELFVKKDAKVVALTLARSV